METMKIVLPPQMKHFVQAQVKDGSFNSVSEYVRELIRADQERRTREQIDNKLLEALDGGPSTPWNPAQLENLKNRARERHSKRRGER